MNLATLNLIVTIVFFVIILFFAIVSLMAAYVFIRYGRSKGITVLTTLVFIGVFGLGALSAFLTLQKIF